MIIKKKTHPFRRDEKDPEKYKSRFLLMKHTLHRVVNWTINTLLFIFYYDYLTRYYPPKPKEYYRKIDLDLNDKIR